MDMVEVNEAFAAQALAVQKELEIPEDIFNINGGAIAVGHPLAASGTRITMHALYSAQTDEETLRSGLRLHRRRSGNCACCRSISLILFAHGK